MATDPNALRKLGRDLAELRHDVKQMMRSGVGLGQSSFDSGAINQYYDDTIGSSFGQQFDGSNGVYVLNGPLPPTPLIIPTDVEQVPGGLRIRWGGQFIDPSAVAPLGFTQVEVHVSEDPLFSGLMFDTLRTHITSARGGEVIVMLPPGSDGYYVRLVTRTNAGRASIPSSRIGPFFPGVVGADIIDPDITAAITAANGKTKVTFSTGLPPSTNPGGSSGDIWFQRDIGGADAKILGAWEWSGAVWLPRTFADSVLSSLTVGKLVSGTLGVGTVMTIGTPGGARIEISGTAIQQFEPDGTTISFQLTPGGSTLFRGTLTGQSVNWTEGTTGWRIEEDGDSFFDSVQVANDITAKSLSATAIDIGGIPIKALIDAKPRGLVAAGFDNTVNLSSIVNETGIVELGFTAYPNRAYMVFFKGGKIYADDDTYMGFLLRATKDGTAPTISSPFVTILPDREGKHDNYGSWPWRQMMDHFLYYPEVTNPNGQLVRLLLSFARTRGLGAVAIDNTSTQLDAWVLDIGGVMANSIRANNSRAASPPPPPPTPVQTHDQTFWATWSASYRANGSRWSEGDKMYQGYGDSFNGNQASLFGFDVATIRALLAGGTIKAASLQLHNWHTWNYSGGTAYIGTHNLTAMPASYASGGWEGRIAAGTTKGGWISVDVTGIASEIRDNASAGFILGHAPNNNNANYGYWYGANYGAERPNLRIIWEK